jgi:hypothetical protein
MAEHYADPDYVMVTALRERLPDEVRVQSTADTNTPLQDATVLVNAVTGSGLANAKPTAGGIWQMPIMVLARDLNAAQRLAGDVLAIVENLERTHVPEAGYISTVDAEILPVRSAPSEVANSAKTFHQYNMQFTVRLRPYTVIGGGADVAQQ